MAVEAPLPASLPGATDRLVGGSPADLVATLKPIYAKFLKDLKATECIRFESERLMKAVMEHAHSTGLVIEPGTVSYQTLMVGYSMADLCYPHHALEVRVFIAIYTWLTLYLDDTEKLGMVDELKMFQQRYIRGEDQPNATLRCFGAHLRLAYDLFDPCAANYIITSTLDYVSASVLNANGFLQEKYNNPSPGGQKFPWFIRRKDGFAEAYAWFLYPKGKYPNLAVPLEAIEDMTKYICLVNDVMSFYKEELSGDTANYIHGVAVYSGGDVFAALVSAADDAAGCAHRIESVLKGKGPYEEAWRIFANGFIHMHLQRTRYRLYEVGVPSAARLDEKEVAKSSSG